jgi:hypothetical protein
MSRSALNVTVRKSVRLLMHPFLAAFGDDMPDEVVRNLPKMHDGVALADSASCTSTCRIRR